VIVGGIVVSQPDARDALARTNLRVEADHLLILRLRSGQVSNLADGIARTVRGLVLVQAPPFTDFRYGDRGRTEGKLKTPTNMAILTIASTSLVRMCIRSCRTHV